jgi:hypothetical protein
MNVVEFPSKPMSDAKASEQRVQQPFVPPWVTGAATEQLQSRKKPTKRQIARAVQVLRDCTGYHASRTAIILLSGDEIEVRWDLEWKYTPVK